MFEKLANIFRIPDLRKRILFTLGLLAVYRLGGHIPTPGINADKLQQFFEQNRGTMFGFVDLFSGGQLRRMTIFALASCPISRRRSSCSCSPLCMSRSRNCRRKASSAEKR